MGQVQCCFELLEHTLCSIWLIQCQLLLLQLEAYHALDDLLGIYICKHCVIGETICPIGGMAVILALVEAAETRDILHMALTLLVLFIKIHRMLRHAELQGIPFACSLLAPTNAII
ncbi:hypothetical protein P3S67_001249 [Capsicum chacoense]